jgi:nitrogen fixation NifU-like protein
MGKSVAEAERIFAAFRHMLTRGPDEDFDYELLGDLEFLESVAKYPVRIKCAVLSWHALNSALDGKQSDEQAVSTE